MTDDHREPGSRLRTLAERVFDSDTSDRIIRPALADLQYERSSASGGWLKRRLVLLRAYWGLWKTLAICFAGDAIRDRQGHAFSIGSRTFFFVLLLLVLEATRSAQWSYAFANDHGWWAAMNAILLLVPSTLTAVLPAAFFLAVALFKTKGSRVATLIPSATAGAVACAAALFIGVMFVVPPINQSFRTFVFNELQPPEPGVPPRVLSKGLAELTWTDLNAEIRQPASSRQQELARAHRQLRFALVGSVFVMALLGLGVASRWRSRAATIGVSLGLLFLYFGCFMLASNLERTAYPSIYGTWTVNMAFALVGLRLLRSRKEWRDDACQPKLVGGQ